MNSGSNVFVGFLSMLVLFSAGCGDGRPRLVPVTGRVTLNGEPLADAQIYFQIIEGPAEFRRPSSGITDAQGNFTIGTFGADDGMPLGKYKVGVQKREMVGKLPENFNDEVPEMAKSVKYKWITPRAYSDLETSGLTAEVTEDGLQPPEIALTSDGGPEIESAGGSSNEP